MSITLMLGAKGSLRKKNIDGTMGFIKMVSRQILPPGHNFKICEKMIFSFAAIYKD